MKLASWNDGSRDGKLIVVSNDGERYLAADNIAPNLQMALDNWLEMEPALKKLSEKVAQQGQPLDIKKLKAPLPRAFEWVDGSAYINHVVLVRKARGAEPPATLRTDPLVYQGGSGVLMGPNDDIPLVDAAWGLDFESEVCVILDDTPMGTKASQAAEHIKLIMIANDVSLRNLIPAELQKGFGFFNSKPATAFAPFAITPDELGDKWQNGRMHLPMVTKYNGHLFGHPNAGPEMHFSFFDLVEHICKSRALTAGTIVGSGTVSNEDRSKGSSCLAEKRMIEKIDGGEIKTPFMQDGDVVEIEVLSEGGQSLFGKINQRVVSVN